MVVELRTENSGVRPQFQYAEELRRPAIRSSFTPASVRTRAIFAPAGAGGDTQRVYKLRWTEAYEGERYKLRKAWADTRGGALAMDYTPVGYTDSAKVSVTFVPKSLSITQTGLDTFDMAVDVMEAR